MAELLIDEISKVIELEEYDDEYVYDIGVNNKDPYFFRNDILVHNSSYFSAYSVLEKDIESGKITWTKDTVISLYDQICKEVNDSFPNFMKKAFHCPIERASVIAAGREIIGSSGLFITKKRYAVLVYDEEGVRKDVDGKTGKLKVMGMDLRRADTPVFVQEFLLKILMKVLEAKPKEEIVEDIIEFRRYFRNLPPWEKGTPKRVNRMEYYFNLLNSNPKAVIPGHVRASFNWNTLRQMNGDMYSQKIVDGMKTIVCKLKNNPLQYTSIAYPVDQHSLPEWFMELPFDNALMEETIVDKKLENLLGVLNFDLSETQLNNTFNDLFDFQD